MKARLLKMRSDLGAAGLAGLALLAGALAFSSAVVKPLEEKNAVLKRRASTAAAANPSAEKVAKVYEFLRKEESATDYLAKLHGIAVATGVQLKSAAYRTQKTEGRIVRYEIALPVSGSYGQIRDFLKRARAEIPVLSVDGLALKRGESSLQAEMRLTLHMVRS